jgi:hypothetical protein
MSVRIKTYAPQVKTGIKNATASGLKRATVFLHSKCREATNIANTGVRVAVKRQTPGGNKKSRTIYSNPSKPGEAPRKRTGWGQRHIVWEFDASRIAGRVGVSAAAIYMLFLELGTRWVKRRPWLVVTLMKNLAMIGQLACTGKPDAPVSDGQGGQS